MSTAFTLLNDEPTLDIDSLPARKKLLDQLTKALLMCSPPQVVGIHGDWGSGKTSFLHRLMYEISGECSGNREVEERAKIAAATQKKLWDNTKVVAVWFEAWRYQHDDAPVVALLNEIRARFSRPRKFWNETKKLIKVASTGALFGLESITKYVGVSAESIQKQGDAYEKEHRLSPLPTQEVRALLEHAVHELLRSNDAERLLVFIDDLDRCSSAAVLSLLEGIKIYLNVKGCVFILGINQHEIERAIARQLSKNEHDDEGVAVRAQEYLEKLCGHIVRLPLLDNSGQRELISKCIKDVAPTKLRDAILDLVYDGSGKPYYDFLPPNPRRLKNFANTLVRLLCAESPTDIAEPRRAARAACIVASLHAFHPELYGALQKAPKHFWAALQAFCSESFPGLLMARTTAATQHHERLKSIIRPYGATPLEPNAALPSDPLLLGTTFNPLFADPSSLDTLFCQQLIADSKLDPVDLEMFLYR